MSGTSISALPTLSNPPPAPFYLTGITNDGTTTANYQVPQGIIVQPTAVGGGHALGVTIAGGDGGAYGFAAGVSIRTGQVTQPGYPGEISGTSLGVDLRGGDITLTDSLGVATGSYVKLRGGAIYKNDNSIYAYGGYFYSGNAYMSGTNIAAGATFALRGGVAGGAATNIGGGVVVNGSYGAQKGGDIVIDAGSAGASGVAGNISLNPGTGTANGVVLVPNRTTDPHVLGAIWTLNTLTGAAAISQG